MFVRYSKGFAMYDLTTGHRIWKKKAIPISRLQSSRMFLTDSICGFLYMCLEKSESGSQSQGQEEGGHFSLLVLDPENGNVIYHKPALWDFLWNTGTGPDWRLERMPALVACGHTLFVSTVHFNSVFDKRAHMRNRFLCLEVNHPNGKKLEVSTTEHGLESVLLSVCFTPEEGRADKELRIDPEQLRFFGVPFGSVVVGCVTFSYRLANGLVRQRRTIFTVDLDEIYHLNEEPKR